MRIPFDKIAGTLKMGAAAKKESDTPVRVSVYVDDSATPFLIDAVREAFVPQTTSALVRVERLGDNAPVIKSDTDAAVVISCGSNRLQPAVQQIVVCGAPTVVLAESSAEVPFIVEDTRMLGLIAATDKTYLLETLARWILDRTEKDTAFAANFPFMRIAAANRIITSSALANMATGALVFIPGADFPAMTLAQLGMTLQLAMVFGKPLRAERGYELAGVVASALALRIVTRIAVPYAGRAAFLLKALVGGLGTYAMGRVLVELYERDVDYSVANEAVGGLIRRARNVVAGVVTSDEPAVSVAQAA